MGNKKQIIWGPIVLIAGIIFILILNNLTILGNTKLTTNNKTDEKIQNCTIYATVTCICENGNSITYYNVPGDYGNNLIEPTCELACAGSKVITIETID